MTKKKITFILLVLTALVLLLFNSALAAGNIIDLTANIDSNLDQAVTEVELNYNLKMEADTEAIPLTGLAFADTRIKDMKASIAGLDLPVKLDQSNPPGFSGSITLPADEVFSDEVNLILTYQVENSLTSENNSFVMEAPLLVVKWKPNRSAPGVFTAYIDVPGEVAVEELFPSTTRTVEVKNNVTSISMGLQTVPSLVRLSGRVGESVFLTYGRKVDLIVILILLISGYLGWYYLKKSKKE